MATRSHREVTWAEHDKNKKQCELWRQPSHTTKLPELKMTWLRSPVNSLNIYNLNLVFNKDLFYLQFYLFCKTITYLTMVTLNV